MHQFAIATRNSALTSNMVSTERPLSVAMLGFSLRALGCIGMAFACDQCGLLHAETIAPLPRWPGMAICHASGTGLISAFSAGLNMGLVMMLVSVAPLRWSGAMSVAGGVTALFWVLGAGVLQTVILVADRIAPMGGVIAFATPRLIVLGVTMGAALHVLDPATAKTERTAFRDGAHCFLRCGPMLIAMMLTGAMSLPWVIGSALLSQFDELAGSLTISRFLICGIGVAAVIGMV